jgi:3-hydroxyacyl-CoA dehydrogenase
MEAKNISVLGAGIMGAAVSFWSALTIGCRGYIIKPAMQAALRRRHCESKWKIPANNNRLNKFFTSK